MTDNTKIHSERLLIVEGKDEKGLLAAIIRGMGLQDVQIQDIEGKDKFRTAFPGFWNSRGEVIVKNMGIVRDAETGNAEDTYKSVAAVLEKLGLPIPPRPGEILDSGSIKIGIFVLPDNNESGMLEDLCNAAIGDPAVLRCVESFLECAQRTLPPDSLRKFNVHKARSLAYFATRVPIVNSIAIAAQKGYIDFSHACFGDMRRFLQELLT